MAVARAAEEREVEEKVVLAPTGTHPERILPRKKRDADTAATAALWYPTLP